MITISFDKIRKLTFLGRHEALATFIVFLCLSAYALGANPFSGQTVAPFDRLLEFSGWSSVQGGVQAVHTERSDILDSQLPTWMTLKDQIRKGESPLWYPNGAGGQPISLELFNPTFLLFVAVKNNALAYYFVNLAKLFISGFGCYLLLRIFLHPLPSIWGGIVFMLCGFNSAWLFWEQVATAMWIPWLLWATVMYLRTENKRWLPAITAASLLLVFGGFPAVAAFGLYSFLLLLLVWNIHGIFIVGRSMPFRDAHGMKAFLTKTALPLAAVGISFLMAGVTIIPFRAAMEGINLGYRTSQGTHFKGFSDLLLFFSYEDFPRVERTAFIGIPALLFAAPGIASAFRNKDATLRGFAAFNVILVIISILIAFGLLPHGLINAIPVFSSNSWGRLIVIPLLGLSVLSSIGLDGFAGKVREFLDRHMRVTPLNARRTITVLLIGLIALQFHLQKALFNRFNAVVPSEWFYPYTPSIAYVKERLRPLQSVIADTSYLFAGTLGAYGIPEWYAHSFRTDKEKEVLGELVRNPFSSPTSMLIFGNNIRFGSPLMDKLAIKYLLVNKGVLERERLFALPELSHDQAPPLPHSSWRQHIHIPDDIAIGAIGFLFGTYGKEHAPANVRISIYNDRGQKFSLEPEIDKNEVFDNRWSFVRFPARIYFPKGKYTMVLSLAEPAGADKLTAWATRIDRENSGSFLEVNGARTDFSLKFQIVHYEKMDISSLSGKWNIIDLEKDIVVLENRQVTNSAYFVKSLDDSNNQIDFSGLDIKQPSSDLLEISYSKGDAGWVVLPMHHDPGWKAYVDGRRVKYDTYLGMLPAIPVQGAGSIVFKYRSDPFRKGLLAGLAGLLSFVAFSGFCMRKPREKS